MRDRIGKFEILRLLGKGAMGEVHLGRDPLLGREVAIKVIQQDTAFGAEAKARFAREAQAAASLSHPNVVTVFEFGADDGLLYLAMEFLQGEDLEHLIRSGGRPKAELLESLIQVCDGLGYAHDRGIVHRDIKPANIFVTTHGHRSTAKLMDFGVAQMGSTQLTEDGTWMGTVSYMAPEYLDSGKAAPSSDLFALGVVLYEVLSGGRRPFEGDSPTMVLNSILRRAPQPLQPADLEGLSPRMLAVVDRALAKDPAQRFADAASLAAAIAEALSDDGTVPAAEAPSAEPAPAPAGKPEEPSRAVLTVGRSGTGRFLSLRVALRHAEPGSVIQVQPGLYRESVVIDKDVQIIGLGTASEVVVDGGRDAALVVRAAGASVQGLGFRTERSDGGPCVDLVRGEPALDGCRFEGGGDACIRIGAPTRALLKDCEVKTSARLALEVAPAAQVVLESCTLEGFQRAGLSLGRGAQAHATRLRAGPATGVGVHVQAEAQAHLLDCEVSAAEAGGIEIEPDGSAELTRCRLTISRFAGLLALERSRATLTECEVGGHRCAGIHAQPGASLVVQRSRIAGNEGYGVSLLEDALATLEGCEVSGNGLAGLLVLRRATAQVRHSKLFDGKSLGVACGAGGQAALDGCEIYGNAGVGAQVEPGGNLLLVRCTLRDGLDTGLLLLEDSRATLEECVVHRNARGGILLAKDASDPELRGANRIEDELLREGAGGSAVKVAPVRRH